MVAIDAIDDVPADGAGSLADSSHSSLDWNSSKLTRSYLSSGRDQRDASWLNCYRTRSLCSALVCAVAAKLLLHKDYANHPRDRHFLHRYSAVTLDFQQNLALSRAGSFHAGRDLGLPENSVLFKYV